MTITAERMHLAGVRYSANDHTLLCYGQWTAMGAKKLSRRLTKSFTKVKSGQVLILDGSKISDLDSAGVWWLDYVRRYCKKRSINLEWQNLSPETEKLLAMMEPKLEECRVIPRPEYWPWIAQLGKDAIESAKKYLSFLGFIGEVFVTLAMLFRHPRRTPWRMFFSTIQNTGYNALPIVGVLSFLIGLVLAYQMGLQLRNYGGNVYIVDLMGIAMLREFGPMMTAIIIAGRSGSAFTAQIGTMTVNQEVDALYTMGIKPVERLVVPKMLGLMVSLPLLTIWADITGIFGGMIMAKKMLGLNFAFFIHRFHEVVPFRWYIFGLVKTPVFALLIATIGCFEGLNVQGSADSVGWNTTKSVVQAIFLVIFADAIFSIALSWLKI